MLVEKVIGNVDDPGWPARSEPVKIDALVLDRWEAQKNRIRKTTQAGTEVALSLDRGSRLRDGDILYWDRAGGAAIVARVELGEVMVVDLGGLVPVGSGGAPGSGGPADTGGVADGALRTAVELGHALGNQHWPAVVKGALVYVPVTVDRAAMDSVMRTHAFRGVTHRFAPGAEIIARLAPHEARLLFGGTEQVGHAHPPPA
jgi:urease accessory protein